VAPLPPAALLDTSLLLRFFVAHDDELQPAIPRIERAWRDDRMQLVLLDLSVYELVNVAVRRLGFDATRARRAVSEVYGLGAPVVAVDQQLAADAAEIAATSGLSGYDAAFVGAARRVGIALLTADRRLAEVDGATSLDSLVS
jgi:predicted nucleic acid-binding protein